MAETPDDASERPDDAPETPDDAPETPDDAPETPDDAPETPDDAPETPEPASRDLDCFCALDGVVDLLSRRCAMQLICVVGVLGPARYGEIEDAFDEVSSSTLSTRLDELVESGIFAREQYDEIPPRVEYELTDVGEELGEHLKPLLRWAERVDDERLSVSQG